MMSRRQRKQNWLAVAITASLLSGFSGTGWAQPGALSTTQMVSPATNQSTTTLPYDIINVNQNSTFSSVLSEDNYVVYVGISNDGSAIQPMSVYLTTPASGNYYTVMVANDGSQNAGRVMAAGVGSLNDAAVTNIYGPLSAQVTATGAGIGKAAAEAIGIGNIAGSLTTETATLSVTAAGGTITGQNNGAKAIAHGIVNGKNAGTTSPITSIGTSTGTNNIAVLATGGTAQGTGNNITGTAYGAENYNSLTFKGETTLSAEAKAGSIASGGNYTAGAAYAQAYGLYNSGSAATIITDALIIDYVKGTGTQGNNVMGSAVGIYNEAGGSVTTGSLAINNVLAKGGTATSDGNAEAEAFGVENLAGVITTGTFDVTVTARAGNSDNTAKATAYGLAGSQNNNSVSLIMGSTGISNTVTVTATGGNASGTDEDNDVSAAAYGVFGSDVTTLKGKTIFSVQATGGRPFEASNLAGNASVLAYGIYNQGTSLTTDDLSFITVSATGKIGSDTHAEAYGLYNSNGEATINTGNLTLTEVKATGGNSSGTGVANAKAAGVWLDGGGTLNTAGSITGTITALGGSGPDGSAEAAGIYSSGSLTAVNVDVNVTARGGSGTENASATAYGIHSENDLLTVADGPSKLTVAAFGGKSLSTDAENDLSATAYGIYNLNQVSLSGVTTIDVQATGGAPTAPDGNTVYLAGNASATAEGIHNEGTNINTGHLLFTQVNAKGGTGYNADATAYGINSVLNDESLTVKNVTFTQVSATGGNASTGGSATATASLVENNYSDTFTALGKITGTVTATGGFGPAANASAYGFNNYGTLQGTGFEITASAAGQTADDEASADARGIVNYGIFSMNDGANKITVTARGGNGGSGSLVNAVAYGIDNYNRMTLKGPTTISVQARGGALADPVGGDSVEDASAEAYGLRNQTDEAATGALTFTLVKAQGGTGDTAYAQAIGIYNKNAPHTLDAASINMTEVSAQGGTGSGQNYAQAYGIKNTFSALETGDNTAVNTLVVRAVGGKATADTANVAAEAYGLVNEDAGRASLLGSWILDVRSTGGSAVDGVTPAYTTADAVGINNQSTNGVEINGPVTITVTADGGAAGNRAGTAAAGIYSENGTVQLLKSVDISAAVTPVSGAEFLAASLYANTNGVINVGTDGTNSLNQMVKLKGDVSAKDENAKINVTLDQADSYLEGNVKEKNGGMVNLVVGGGATWKPVYDNRYGSFYDKDGVDTFSKDYTVSANAITRLTLNEGGVVDLTWDNATRNPSTNGRSLTISRFSGNNGIFKLNSDLANNVADKLSFAGADAAANNAYIQVKYDPYLATANLAAGNMLNGKAEVVSAAPSSLAFTGKPGEYNLYQYTPTVVKDTDGKWYLTNITINNVTGGGSGGGDTGGGDTGGGGTGGGDTGGGTGGGGNTGGTTVTTITGPVRTVAQTHLGLQNLFLGEVNNLEKRLGDLRQTSPAEAGVWARYNHGNLEHNESSVKYNLFQAGVDKESNGPNEKTYRGLAVSHAKGSGSYEIGSGDLSETTLSLYQTGIKKNGQYYDVILKAGRYSNNYDLVSEGSNKSSADYHTWAYSISGEYGVRKQLGHGFYVEPQAELILGRIQGADYVTSTNMNAHVEAQNKAIARLGVAAGKEFKGGTLYGKANFFHDFSGGVHIKAADGSSSVSYNDDVAHNWCELSLGGTAKAGKNMVVYGELSKYLGQLKSNLQVNVGARWTF